MQYRDQFEKMTQAPVGRLVVTLGLPTTVSMLVTNIYNMADTYFVSGIGVFESGATGVVYTLMMLNQAIGFCFGSGAGSKISRMLGAEEKEAARNCSATTFYSGIAFGVLFALACFAFLEPLLFLLGSTVNILGPAKAYAVWILLAIPAMMGSFILNNILRYEGKAFYAMVGLGTGGVLNIFGDWLLIRGLQMGIAGAGIATCITQYLSLFLLILPFLRGKAQTSLSPRFFKKDPRLISSVLYTGMPSLIRQGLFGLSSMTLNHCARIVGEEFAIAAMSIVNRVANLLYCSSVGIGQGFQPVSGYNFGAKKYERIRKAMIFMAAFSILVLAVLCLFGFLFAEPIIRFFREDPEILEIGIPALRAQCVILPFVSLQTCANMTYQSIGYAARASLMASFRSGLFYIPVVILFSNLLGMTGLIYAQPAADMIGTIVTLPFLIWIYRRFAKWPAKENAGT